MFAIITCIVVYLALNKYSDNSAELAALRAKARRSK